MVAIYKDFTLNFFYIFFIPAVFFVITRRIRDRKWLYRISICVIYAVSLVSSMSLPVTINGLIYDFRAIPLTLGSLYGGVPVSIVLCLILIVYRHIMGNVNQLEYILSILPTLLIVAWIISKYAAMTVGQKVLTSMATYFIIRMLTLATYQLLTDNAEFFMNPSFPWTLTLIVLQSLLTGAFTYLLEFMERLLRFQEEIRKTEKMKLVTSIAASVAHEVRNPLTTVRGFIQLLGKEGLSQRNRSYYQKICLEELDRAQQIISDYLTLAKPDPERIESIDIVTEIRYAANVLSSYANMQNVRIDVERCEQDIQIVGDQTKFRQALINLCKNSIEAMPEGGTLTLETGLDKINPVIYIKDTGVGMTKEQLNRLGTPFYSTKEKGTGLGTMVAFSIIRTMAGEIETTSELGKGTAFRISFSRSSSKAILASTAQQPKKETSETS
ncbi:ATP-binding protein [Paenibacillus mendelii]|uniref:histidine kinase n=1 Tax=Paenibacillus mendelii TaxID=206163 RepID=A0ABV6JHZ7_9BACL|nr:ATP-binding protein [Paenibacillus mendelii]MCQ6558412.1 ATP-binding protein [Paenibacillus mendelii]